jgi:hypothetical protein
MYLQRIQPTGAWWEALPPVRLYNFVKGGAEYAGEQSAYIETALKSGDTNLIGSAIDRAIAPVQDAVRNTVTLVLVAGVGYVAFKYWLVKKAAKKIAQ